MSADATFQRSVIERDRRCLLCGRGGGIQGALTAHHIIHRRYRRARYDAKNGIALCHSCHTIGADAVHRLTGSAEIRCVLALIDRGVWSSMDAWDDYKRQIMA